MHLTIHFVEKSPTKPTVTKWCRKFQLDDRCLKMTSVQFLVTAIAIENIVKAKEDPRITHEEIQDTLGISSGSRSNFLCDHLSV